MKKEATFFLDKPKGNEVTHVFMKFTCQDSPLKYSTGYKIHPSKWNPEFQLSIPDKKDSNTTDLNAEIARLSSIVSKYQESCRLMVKPVLKDELRQELNVMTARKEKSSKNRLNLYDMVEMLIDEAKAGKILTPLRRKYSDGTIYNWSKVADRLKEFDSNMDIEAVTLKTYYNFIAHCNAKNYALGYTGRLIKDWKNFMNLCSAKGWSKNLIQNHKEFKKLTEKSEHVYLDEEEIMQIYNLDLSKQWNLENIRDRFIIDLYTGLRISDMKQLTIKHFQDGIITQINEKTGKKVDIPVHPIVTDIISKYDGKLPKQYNEQTVNREIKQICRMAGLTQVERYSKTKGGIRVDYTVQKWQRITNHTCRRSMATNLLKMANTQDVMPILGMSAKTLELYNKRTSNENAKMMADNEFFKKK